MITFPIPRGHDHHDLVEERSSPLPHAFRANTSVCLTCESHAAALPPKRPQAKEIQNRLKYFKNLDRKEGLATNNSENLTVLKAKGLLMATTNNLRFYVIDKIIHIS